MSPTRRHIAFPLLLLAGCARAETASVQIVEPGSGEVISDSNVEIVLQAAGIEIAPASEERPGTAHHHLFVDRDLTPLSDTIPSGVPGILHLGRGQTRFLLREVAPGDHIVIALLADRNHVPLSPPAADTINFTTTAVR